MPRYLIWKSGPGHVELELRRAGEALLRPSMSIVSPSGAVAVERQDLGESVRFRLAADEVERLLNPSGPLRPPCIMLQCDAFMGLASARRCWGWSIRISRDGMALPAHHLDGSPLRQSRDGFIRARLQHFPEHSTMARGLEIIGLA